MKQETTTTPDVEDCNQSNSSNRHIASFVVLDLETNDLPHIFSKVAITELCMYGFAASELEAETLSLLSDENGSPLPKRPRILHKLALLFNPRRLIHPSAEGLSNFSLEKESHFDENAGITVLNFIKHMQQPVCLVAHNGDSFDFPVIKQTLQKLNMEMPEGILCLDSLRAFWGIDEQLLLDVSSAGASTSNDCPPDHETDTLPMLDLDVPDKAHILDSKEALEVQLDIDEKVNWQEVNEKTPKRPTVAGYKRSALNKPLPKNNFLSGNDVFKSKRALFTGKLTRKYPPKGVYKLGNLYERHFKKQPKEVHYAEADVETLMNLMKVYGINFLAFAENHAIPFNDIKIKIRR
ncbi:uncharacterized protein [Eurosta solidaginis]|uniref:uncharacterized protein isoform X2 n=1 Tax=Eurosta solidaginis TaxID=178769 RepID=UPI003530A4D4